MKKFFFFLSAIALLGLTAACVEQQEVNPNYNPETREVNANFVFNIATNNSPMTKQTAENTQANVTSTSDFRGISNGKLFAYKLATAGNIVTGENPEKLYDLPNIVPANSIGPNGEDKSRRILELSIPTETNAFLFYGKAPKNASNNFDQGLIDYTVNATALASNAFSLKPIVVEKNATTEIADVEGLISWVLTKLLNFSASISVGNNPAKTIKWSDYGEYNRTGYDTGLKWKCATINPYLGGNNPITPLGEIVGNGFANFVSVRSGAVRAGSGPSVARMIGDLAVSIGSVAKATPTSDSEEATQKFARALITEFAKYFDICDGGTLNTTTYANVTTDADGVDWSSSAYSNANQAGYSGSSVALAKLQQFPTEFDLPMGAAQLIMNEDPDQLSAKYPSQVADTDINIFNGNGTTDVSKFTYPAELCYFGNSPIRVTDETVAKSEYPDGAGSDSGMWLNDASWTSKLWSARGGTVTSSTRSVAMADNINYGTALFGYTIGYSDATLEDNTKGIPGLKNEDAKTFSSSTAEQFKLTGILIGGQYKTVGWNYIAKDGEQNNTNYIVYDKVNVDVPTGTGTPNDPQAYTMVWDNYNASASTAGTTTADGAAAAAGQDAVYVALEFKNNTGGDFWGEKNVIRKDGTFYIVGKLTVPSDVTKFQWPVAPDYYALPPYENGATKQVVRVFMQDYLTLAHFTLGRNSLKHAYVTVPDLRTGQLSLGLSVDLQWRAGLSYNIVLGEQQ